MCHMGAKLPLVALDRGLRRFVGVFGGLSYDWGEVYVKKLRIAAPMLLQCGPKEREIN